MSLLITLGLSLLLLVPSSAKMIVNTMLDKEVIAYGQVRRIPILQSKWHSIPFAFSHV